MLAGFLESVCVCCPGVTVQEEVYVETDIFIFKYKQKWITHKSGTQNKKMSVDDEDWGLSYGSLGWCLLADELWESTVTLRQIYVFMFNSNHDYRRTQTSSGAFQQKHQDEDSCRHSHRLLLRNFIIFVSETSSGSNHCFKYLFQRGLSWSFLFCFWCECEYSFNSFTMRSN